MNYRHILSLLCLAGATQLSAITPKRQALLTERQLENIVKQYEDSLASLTTRLQTTTMTEDPDIDPRYYKLFGIPTLYQSSVTSTLTGEEHTELYPSEKGNDYLSLHKNSVLDSTDAIEKEIDRALLMVSLETPQSFVFTEEQVKAAQTVDTKELANQEPTANIMPEIVLQHDKENKAVGVEMKVKKPNFWKTSGEAWLQFTQNYVSGNWSQGGESTNSLQSGLTLNANYNDKQKIQWDNKFEAKLGFTTAPSDSEHKYRTNTDMLRLSSTLLLKAIKSWNYSFGVTSQTQSLRNYPANNNKYTSAFLAPLDTRVSVGMDYKKSLKNFSISINLAPLSYRWLYVAEKHLGGRYGIKADHRSLQEFGSSTKINSSWQIAKNIRWTSHIDAFTSYEKLLANWENTFDFAVSKYLSTKLFLHGRFDDGVKKKDGYTYFQFKEFLQFGLSYKW